MKNLILACSPRRGSTSALAEAAAEALDDALLVRLAGLRIAPCDGCEACARTGVCPRRDDAAGLYRALLAAQNVFFFAPVYFCGFDAHTKAFLDRGQYLWAGRGGDRARRYYLIACGGQRTAHNFDGLIVTLRAHALTTGGRYRDGLLFDGVDAPGDLTEAHFAALRRFLAGCAAD